LSDIQELKAFHERDTEELLKKLNLLKKVEAGQVTCTICGKSITKENLGGIIKKESMILMVCDDLDCLHKAGELMR